MDIFFHRLGTFFLKRGANVGIYFECEKGILKIVVG